VKFKRPRQLSSNIEDRRAAGPQRGRSGTAAAGIGGVGGIGAIIVLVVAFCAGGGANSLSPGGGTPSLSGGDAAGQTLEAPIGAEEDPLRDEAELASVVLDNNQFFWSEVFTENDLVYQEAKLVLFSGATPTGCGEGDAGMGPFYCSADDTAYIDLTFWSELANRFGATGDFAQAYVISHEIAHHVQNKLGISAEVRQEGAQNPADRNALSVAQELQADCFAGVWANSVWTDGNSGDPAGIEIDESDIREALDAAEAVGDDKIQLNTTGQINQDTWTHGSAEQRQEWFTRGFESGDPSKCDTFS
jgi:predicted metalloprotease